VRRSFEQSCLQIYIKEAKKQNQEYFELKARELLSREKSDIVSQASANLLFQSLKMTREEILAKYPHFVPSSQKEEQVADEESQSEESETPEEENKEKGYPVKTVPPPA